MGKASRTKAARRAAPPPVGKKRQRDPRTTAIAAGTALVLIAAIVAVVVFVTRGGSGSGSPSSAAASNGNASASLVKAANAVGFSPNTEAGVGQIESKPASAASAPTNPNLLAVGAKAPNFRLKTPEGKTYSLKQFRGKTVLIEFFATWCPHCDAEAPHLKQIYASLPKSKFQFLGVNADGEEAPSVYAYHHYFGLQFPTLLDPSSQPGSFHQPGAAGPVTTQYQIASFPTFYVVGPKGVIQFRTDGEQPDALLKQELLSASKA